MAEEKLKVKDFQLVSHMHLSNQGIRLDSGIVVWPGNPIDGKRIYRQITTPKKKHGGWGEGVADFFLEGEKMPSFDSAKKLEAHYAVLDSYASKEPEPPLVRVKVKPGAKNKNDGKENDC